MTNNENITSLSFNLDENGKTKIYFIYFTFNYFSIYILIIYNYHIVLFTNYELVTQSDINEMFAKCFEFKKPVKLVLKGEPKMQSNESLLVNASHYVTLKFGMGTN